jgi:hypothetical protein
MMQAPTIVIAIASALAPQANTAGPKPGPYPLPTVQSVASSGGEIVRASFIDGYGKPAGVVAFMRRPGEEPRVEVRTAAGGTLATAVPLDTWERVRSAAALFDRTLAPLPKADRPSICLHPWSVSVEAVDPARSGRPAAIRKAVQSTCDTGLAVPLAFELAREAVAALPACALLDARQYRNDISRLAGCTLLEGDRAAAALARNAYGSDWFASTRGDRTEYAIRHLFFDQARIDWAGTTVEGSSAAAKIWSSQLENASVFPRHIIGETADRVRIEGVIVRFTGNRSTQAPVTMVWTSENGFGFRVRSAVVGAEEPAGGS